MQETMVAKVISGLSVLKIFLEITVQWETISCIELLGFLPTFTIYASQEAILQRLFVSYSVHDYGVYKVELNNWQAGKFFYFI